MRSLGVPELDAYTGPGFDAIFSYSSLEHDDLGRYTDPLNPNGDIERMQKLAGLIAPHGKLYLGLPTGRDGAVI
ncbi:TPR domain [Micractinium conductrix]|uniref:TPR domain n=1 Tax=Micractinium conductrix TaxID=554055 RepID=A0A2P6VKH9_9CHLO|nr:TPR domain [Micractinium conductrix]|eukprot:PSC74595.1 TPR domain [Micractinium conductrix]